MKTFGEYIKTEREKLGIPQRKIAAFLDIDTSTLSKIERNERRATSSMIKIISEQLNLKLNKVEYEFLKDSILSDYNKLDNLKESLTKISKEL
jgi:transcriptional regulator with XRE-family HTH domain